MFAPNKLNEMENLDENIDELLSYYEGNYSKYGSGGLGTEKDVDSGVTKKWNNMSYDVFTNKNTYRIAIIWHILDTADKGNVGIWSLYVIKFEDDIYPTYSYGGDGNWTPGLHIGKTFLYELT